ncbi:MAG: preprotein translocase subunit SecG [Planctomycetota bacterium]|nr:MAG: preprotein translocase subunit SecG [Planctomycetota bacterium]
MSAVLSLIFWIAFFASAILLIIVILLQEPKGGGLAEAFGGMGAQTFGVKSGGTNRFTFTVFAVFLFSAMGIHALKSGRIGAPGSGAPEQQEPKPNEGAPAGTPVMPPVAPAGEEGK